MLVDLLQTKFANLRRKVGSGPNPPKSIVENRAKFSPKTGRMKSRLDKENTASHV